MSQWGYVLGPNKLPSEEARVNLGTVGVVSARFLPEPTFPTVRGRIAGAAVGAVLGFLAAPFQAHAGAVLIAPFTILAGALRGASAAEPIETVEEAETALKRALADFKIQETMRDRILETAQQKTPHRFTVLTNQGPTAIDEEVSYRSLASQGIESIVEVSLREIQMEGLFSPVALTMNARVKLIRLMDGTVTYSRLYFSQSERRNYSEWADDDAQLFREALDRGYQGLIEKIVDDLFLVYPFPGQT